MTGRQTQDELVGPHEIAQRAGVKADTVHAWRARHEDFPQPLAELAMGAVWSWPAVKAWLERPRPAGQHKPKA